MKRKRTALDMARQCFGKFPADVDLRPCVCVCVCDIPCLQLRVPRVLHLPVQSAFDHQHLSNVFARPAGQVRVP